MAVVVVSVPDREALLASARQWWLRILAGVLFLILGFVILGYDTRSLVVLSVFLGVSFLLSALTWFLVASVADEFRGVWIAGGVLGLACGILAFAYPDETLRVLSLLLGWFLLLGGLVHTIGALMNRDRELWWMSLVFGIILFGLGAWSVGETDRSVIVLATIVGVYCVLKGILELVAGVRMHRLKRELLESPS
jgi:uncharacterized membrane protein HdeD (DUF308 family)